MPTKGDIAVILHTLQTRDAAHGATPSTESPLEATGRSQNLTRKNYDVQHNAPDHLRLKVRKTFIDLEYSYLFGFQRDVRELTAELLKLPDTPLRVPSERQLRRFKQSNKAEDGPCIDDLQLDLANKSIASPWNDRAAYLFAKKYIDSGDIQNKTKDQVSKVFKAHLPTLQKRYRKQVLHGREQDLSDAEDDTVDAARKKANQIRRRAVCGNIFLLLPSSQLFPKLRQRRKDVCVYFGKDSKMQSFIPVLEKMPYYSCSGDESCPRNGEARYEITNLRWRNTAIREWFHALDALHMSTRFQVNGRPLPGALPHYRVNSDRVEEDAPPVVGLPRNFYDEEWLEDLDEIELEQLDVQPPMDITFSPAIQR